ncbi:MAG: NAD-dependent malic enzyme, partial [Trichodesmium sp. St17_bin3_1_1]|nr:NAD-dependent malic enzyme [Trichodesmium sp. St17_bin3_1_1]
MVQLTPNPSFSLTICLETPNRAGMLANVTKAIASQGGNIGNIDLLKQSRKITLREITIDAYSTEHSEKIVQALKALPEIKVVNLYDRTFNLHRGGKIAVQGKIPLKSQADLSMAYTPGVGRISKAVAEEPEQIYNLNIKQN